MGCPYLSRPADTPQGPDRVVPGICRDSTSGFSTVPGFWQYWNRCTTSQYIRCPWYRRHQQLRATAQLEGDPSLRRCA
jgi:hypothetical protein